MSNRTQAENQIEPVTKELGVNIADPADPPTNAIDILEANVQKKRLDSGVISIHASRNPEVSAPVPASAHHASFMDRVITDESELIKKLRRADRFDVVMGISATAVIGMLAIGFIVMTATLQ